MSEMKRKKQTAYVKSYEEKAITKDDIVPKLQELVAKYPQK